MSPTEWRSLLPESEFGLFPAVHPYALDRAEAELDTPIPPELRDLYLASDGVIDLAGEWFVIWPLARLVEANKDAWTRESGGRRTLLAFGDNGAGEPFCLHRDGSPGVAVWYPIEHGSDHLAENLEAFWRGWNDGTIST